jgi:AcrR family transcriptional regulator
MAVERGIPNVTLAEIAKRAGVSRQAIYLFFGNRAGLLKAMTVYRDESAGVPERLQAAIRAPSPQAAISEFVRIFFGYLPQIDPVAYALAGAATMDADAHEAWQSRINGLRGLFLRLTRRMAAEGFLANGWNAREAADFIYAQAHYLTWRHLVIECGWTSRQAADRIARTLIETLVRKQN